MAKLCPNVTDLRIKGNITAPSEGESIPFKFVGGLRSVVLKCTGQCLPVVQLFRLLATCCPEIRSLTLDGQTKAELLHGATIELAKIGVHSLQKLNKLNLASLKGQIVIDELFDTIRLPCPGLQELTIVNSFVSWPSDAGLKKMSESVNKLAKLCIYPRSKSLPIKEVTSFVSLMQDKVHQVEVKKIEFKECTFQRVVWMKIFASNNELSVECAKDYLPLLDLIQFLSEEMQFLSNLKINAQHLTLPSIPKFKQVSPVSESKLQDISLINIAAIGKGEIVSLLSRVCPKVMTVRINNETFSKNTESPSNTRLRYACDVHSTPGWSKSVEDTTSEQPRRVGLVTPTKRYLNTWPPMNQIHKTSKQRKPEGEYKFSKNDKRYISER